MEPFLLLFFLLLSSSSALPLLPQQEVSAIQLLSTKSSIKAWSRAAADACTVFKANTTDTTAANTATLACDCSFFNNSLCHITSIQLKGLNLTGPIPDFSNFTFLQEIDLSRNYLHGPLPQSLSNLPLVKLSVLGNRLSGTVPAEIGNISTLEEIVLENNDFNGTLPENVGNLPNLSRLIFSANRITGILPATFAKLSNLTDLRADGNALSGKIPDFLGNLKKLNRLDLQGSSLDGPIPHFISSLTELTQLRISDLAAPTNGFPDIHNLKKLKELVLRNCQISGQIPHYIGDFKELKSLDLSFNLLSGVVPPSLENLNLQFLFLAANSLTGGVPEWVVNSKKNFDLSHNSFTGNTTPSSCLYSDINLVSSYPSSSSSNGNNIDWCFKKEMACPLEKKYGDLFINCGGQKSSYEGREYEEDSVANGMSTFFSSSSWAYSSMGVFMGNEENGYIVRKPASLKQGEADIYADARLSPISLKYYGLCLEDGLYNVRLHFAEILFSDDETFSSVGKRVFDVKIQGRVVLKDFNIGEEAKGVGRGVVREIKGVTVKGSPLEIHLYWAGKGTTAIPTRGIYGPLISAISVLKA